MEKTLPSDHGRDVSDPKEDVRDTSEDTLGLRRPAAASAGRTLVVALTISVLAALASWFLPSALVGTAVGGIFLGAVWILVLRHRDEDLRGWGLSFGGALDIPAASFGYTIRRAFRALAWTLGLSAAIFPVFALGYAWWFGFSSPLQLRWMPPGPLGDVILGQLLVVALPEEAFFRGWLQTSLDRAWGRPVRILGAKVGWGLVVTSALFALGHVATIPHASRLAVFFPSLLFGWLRIRTAGIGAALLFHAACNLLTEGLFHGTHH